MVSSVGARKRLNVMGRRACDAFRLAESPPVLPSYDNNLV